MQIFYSDPFGRLIDLVTDGFKWAGKFVQIQQAFRVLGKGEDWPPGTLKITVKSKKFLNTQTIRLLGIPVKTINEGFWVQ